MTNPNLEYLALRRFTDFVESSPDANPPGPNDYVPLTQDNITKRLNNLSGLGGNITIVDQDIYDALSTDYIIAVYRTVGHPTQINLLQPPITNGKKLIILDLKGDADVNNIHVTGGTMDNLADQYLQYPFQVFSVEWIDAKSIWKVGV